VSLDWQSIPGLSSVHASHQMIQTSGMNSHISNLQMSLKNELINGYTDSKANEIGKCAGMQTTEHAVNGQRGPTSACACNQDVVILTNILMGTSAILW
jgi:hypothetical protein